MIKTFGSFIYNLYDAMDDGNLLAFLVFGLGLISLILVALVLFVLYIELWIHLPLFTFMLTMAVVAGIFYAGWIAFRPKKSENV